MSYILPICLGKLITQNVQYLAKDAAVLHVIFQNYFQESLLEDVICENCSSGSYESIKSTFTV